MKQDSFKHVLWFFGIISICAFGLFFMSLVWETKQMSTFYNQTFLKMANLAKQSNPALRDEDILKLLNTEEVDSSFAKLYHIDVSDPNFFLANESQTKFFYGGTILCFLFTIFLFLGLLWWYQSRRQKKIIALTHYMEQLNQQQYSLELDDLREDELSILKNEIYKTTIMLKEIANESIKDKTSLKQSLEDIAHQLKTPLTSMLLLLDNLISYDFMEEEVRVSFYHELKREVQRMNFFVNSMLKLSKIETNTIEYHKEEVSIKPLLEEAILNVSALSDLKNISVTCHGDDATLICDFKWQVEAITNLLKNAIDYSKEGSFIEITYTKSNVSVLVTILNTGSAIEPHVLEHLFDRFYQGSNAHMDSYGIGLALAKAIIKEDNGVIEVSSKSNQTIFTIQYFR